MLHCLKKLAITACVLNACAAYAIDDKVGLNLSGDDYIGIGDVPKVLTVSRLAQSK